MLFISLSLSDKISAMQKKIRNNKEVARQQYVQLIIIRLADFLGKKSR
jgi:hypothetical protein